MNKAFSIFEWKNLPKEVNPHDIEAALFSYGDVSFTNKKERKCNTMITKLTTYAVTMRELCVNTIKMVENDEKLSPEEKDNLLDWLIVIRDNIDELIYDLEH